MNRLNNEQAGPEHPAHLNVNWEITFRGAINPDLHVELTRKMGDDPSENTIREGVLVFI